MDFLKKLADIGRRHYEKLLLCLVLLLLAAAVLYLNNLKETEEKKIKEYIENIKAKKGSPVKPIDISANDAALKIITNPPPLNFSLPHHLFNPVKWQRRPPPDGTLIKLVTGDEVGLAKMTILRINPLNFIIELERIPSPGSYYIKVTREAAERAVDRKPRSKFATTNSPKNEVFTLKEVKGPPEDPSELVLELPDATNTVSISKEKPYTRIEGYEADLKYTLDGKTFNNLRLNSVVRFQGEDYIVVAISPTEVVLLARSNDKKHTVKQTAAQ
jgi:hypothetical protein